MLFCGLIGMIEYINISFIEFQAAGTLCNGLSPGPSEARYLAVSWIFGFFMKLFALTLSHKQPMSGYRGRESRTSCAHQPHVCTFTTQRAASRIKKKRKNHLTI